MPDKYLYDSLLEEFGKRSISEIEIPRLLTDNLSSNFLLRPYQINAFQRFFCYYNNSFDFKETPIHLLFNMATGSGKTLIMAGLILYLYEKGYRNFIFFVNSLNIIEKTKDNFLNPASIKYLFNDVITINDRRVQVTAVPNFDGANPNDINICFTTIQKLHIDLTVEKENAISFEDFRNQEIVLISDESHHMNVQTRAGVELFESWENTVQKIFVQNPRNILLEFTATHDFTNPAMIEKYRNKVIFRYDLPEFRNDGFSKDVSLVYSDFGLNERILQALILSQYKQHVAAKFQINLKSVILFKAQRTIAQSKENKENFHNLIESLTGKKIAQIRKSKVPIILRAFRYFDENGIPDEKLAEILKREFREEFCLSVNDDAESVNYQILVNTLEDKDNRIRAIFAVQKLNEGWDVLNLFDIVRCYETRDSGQGVIGKTTTSEAQLIGRGARYFPFVMAPNTDRFRRKFDNDLENELRVIEELHYHSINDSRYIAEIRSALVTQGILDPTEEPKEMKLKESFKNKPFYKYGRIFLNKPIARDYRKIFSFADLGVSRRNFVYQVASGQGGQSLLLNATQQLLPLAEGNRADVPLSKIERNIIQSAIARNPFYTFKSLKRFFGNLTSIQEFIDSTNYLAGLEITFQGNLFQIEDNKLEKLNAVLGLLKAIEEEIRQLTSFEFEGSKEFSPSFVHTVFKDKTLKLSANNERLADHEQLRTFISTRDWYPFDSLYGTTEERSLLFLMDREISNLKRSYDEVYLMRNEGHFAIYNFSDGQAFQPDFVLFLREKGGEIITYQLFIEPKGEFISEHDRWKEDFLSEIKEQYKDTILHVGDDANYRLIGVPFYNSEDENAFRQTLEAALNT